MFSGKSDKMIRPNSISPVAILIHRTESFLIGWVLWENQKIKIYWVEDLVDDGRNDFLHRVSTRNSVEGVENEGTR